MGSLILLLLVLDRRAKAVARARALQALTQKDKETLRAAEERRAEWERRRQELHAHLAQEDGEVVAQIKSLEGKIATAQGAYQSEQARFQELQRLLQTEAMRLRAGQAEGAKARQTDEKQKKQSKAAQAELTRLAADLEQMEQTLADLKALRQRQAQTYSLVPYRGKRGENRRPLYVECTSGGLIFHPDRLTLEGAALAPSVIRAEVQRRILRQQGEETSAAKKAQPKPYLLMLVRPAGITNYYRTQAALAGLQVDFGYEFLEADWALDFSAEGGPQPWMAASPTVAPPKGASPPRKPSPPRKTLVVGMEAFRGVQGVTFGAGSDKEPGPPGTGSFGPIGAPFGPPGSEQTKGNGNEVQGSGFVRPPVVQFPGLPGWPGAFPGGTGQKGSVGPPGVEGIASGNSVPSGPGKLEPSARQPGAGGSKEGVSPRMVSPPGPPSGKMGSGEGNPGVPPAAPLAPGAPSGKLNPGEGTGGPVPWPLPPLGASGGVSGPHAESGTSGIAMSGSPEGQSVNPGASVMDKGNNKSGGNTDNPAASAPKAPAAGAAVPGASGQAGNGSGESAPGGSESAQGFRVRPMWPTPRKAPVVRPPVPLSRLTGNRDWNIVLECTADGLILRPSGQKFSNAVLAAYAKSDNALAQAIRQIIARRQASVRPGEPPYRPFLRFQIHPDGLRTFYLAYPVLESVGVPMTRQNLDPESAEK
jgi:hypothetical protein